MSETTRTPAAPQWPAHYPRSLRDALAETAEWATEERQVLGLKESAKALALLACDIVPGPAPRTAAVLGVSAILRELGFTAAADDVHQGNLEAYAGWVLTACANRAWRFTFGADREQKRRVHLPEWDMIAALHAKVFKALGIAPKLGGA